MSQLIRWRNAGARLVVLWYDDRAGRTKSTEVDPVTLERLDGEPLCTTVYWQLADDLTQQGSGKATTYYQGITA